MKLTRAQNVKSNNTHVFTRSGLTKQVIFHVEINDVVQTIQNRIIEIFYL